MTLSIGVNWTPASGSEMAAMTRGSQDEEIIGFLEEESARAAEIGEGSGTLGVSGSPHNIPSLRKPE